MTENIAALIAQLHSPEVKQRSDAVLRLQPGSGDDSRAIAALVHVLCTDQDLNVVEDATWVLAKYGAAATQALLQAIDSDDPRVRHNIVHALGKLADAQGLPALIAASRDPDDAVRQKAVYALGQLRDPHAIDSLISRLGDPVQNIQWTAREALAGFGDQALVSLLLALMDDSNTVRELAASLLGDIGDPNSVDALITALATDDWELCVALLQALGQIGEARALPAVERMRDAADSRVAAIAKMIAKQLGENS